MLGPPPSAAKRAKYAVIGKHKALADRALADKRLMSFKNGKSHTVEACTGSGKTLAFAIPIVEMLRRRQHSQMCTR